MLSRAAKEAIKTALAMTIAIGIALQMGWEHTKWAGFAIAMISLSTIGQSLNKAALRLLGTLIGIIVAFILLALFAQDRWLFMGCLSVWVAFCTYMMGGPKHQYAWHVSAFVCTIVCMEAGPDALNSFQIATLRSEQTVLGITVYVLISIFLWPTSSGPQFGAAAAKLAAVQNRLFGAYLDVTVGGKTDDEGVRALCSEESEARADFDRLLASAVTDDVEVGELRRQWREYQRLASELAETMEGWRECFAELQSLVVQGLLPGFAAFGAELDARHQAVERMLADKPPEHRLVAVNLTIERSRLTGLSQFQSAALTVIRARLRRLETLTRELFDCVSSIKDRSEGRIQAAFSKADNRRRARVFVLDLDRAAGAVRVFVSLWLGFTALIYVNGWPGGAGFLNILVPIGVAIAPMPQLRVSKLYIPVSVGVLIGGGVNILVMPHLSSFASLGLVIFAVTFAICRLFAAPQRMLGRAFSLAFFISLASISNEQTYNFLSVANVALMMPLLFLILGITAHIPVSPRPERAFLRLTHRYFRSCEYLISVLGKDSRRPQSRLVVWRTAFHQHEVATLPAKLGAWAPFIDPQALPGTSPKQVHALVASLEVMTRRMLGLPEERVDHHAPVLIERLRAEFRAWRLAMQEGLRRLSRDPAAVDQKAARRRLADTMKHLEERITETLEEALAQQISAREAENFYRLLGAFRAVSEALVDYAKSADAIEWAGWREERFA